MNKVMRYKHSFEDCTLAVFAAAAFEVGIVMSSFFRGISYFTVDDFATRSIQGQDLGPWDTVWSLMFLICAPIIFYAISKPNINVRVFGLFLLGTALTMSSVAVISVHPLDGRSYASLFPGLACFLKVGLFWWQYNFQPRRKSHA
jgi:hypothetical protein